MSSTVSVPQMNINMTNLNKKNKHYRSFIHLGPSIKYVTRLGEGGRRSVTRGPKFRDVTSKSYAIRYQNTNFELLT